MLIDMGFVSWRMAWEAIQSEVDPSWRWLDRLVDEGALLCFDSSTSIRKATYPWYKQHRGGWEERYEKETMREYARQWCHRAKERYPFDFMQQDGLEADDFIGWYYEGHDVLAIDKDFLQLPGIRLVDFDLVPWSFERAQKKVTPNISSPERFLAYQLLHGDTTDCIPRTIPSSDRKTIPNVLATDTPLLAAIETLPRQVAVDHLNVLLVPTPLVRHIDPIDYALRRYGYEVAERENGLAVGE